MIIPGLVLIENDSSSETSSRVDTSSSDWNCGQVNHEYSESNWEWCQYLLIQKSTPSLTKTKMER